MRLPRIFKKLAPLSMGELFASDGEHSGLFVGWFLDAPTADALALETEGATPAAELHVTVCYGGDLEDIPDIQIMRAIENARQCIEYSRPMAGVVSGVGRFQAASEDEGDLDVIYAGVDVPGLAELHTDIRNAFARAGFPDPNHGFTPHITLAFVAPGSPLPVESVPNLPLNIQALTINAGRFTETIELGRAFDAMPAQFGEGVGDKGRVFIPVRFAEAAPWIPYLPIPGTYSHPRYGSMAFSRDRLSHFVEQFNAGIYQEKVPLDAEHETKLSGAVGWITKLRQNANGSVDAAVEWTDRGRELLAQNRFKYVSAEFFDEWESPLGEKYTDVAIGGAICTRPFFKESVLRPLAASETPPNNPEEGTMADESPETKAASEPIQMADLQRQLSEERAARELAETERKTLTERVERMAADTRRKTFTDEVMGRSADSGIRWYGEPDKHIAHLESLAKAFGEDSDEVTHYRDLNRRHAKSFAEAGLFKEIGRSGEGDIAMTATEELAAKAKAFREEDAKLTTAQALAKAGQANPDLVRKSRQEAK